MNSPYSNDQTNAYFLKKVPEFASEDVRTHYVPLLSIVEALAGSSNENINTIVHYSETHGGLRRGEASTLDTENFLRATGQHPEGDLEPVLGTVHVSYDTIAALIDERKLRLKNVEVVLETAKAGNEANAASKQSVDGLAGKGELPLKGVELPEIKEGLTNLDAAVTRHIGLAQDRLTEGPQNEHLKKFIRDKAGVRVAPRPSGPAELT